MKYRWNAERALRPLWSRCARNIDDAAMHLVGAIKDRIGVQGPPRSAPGNPPHMDTRVLHDSIDHATDPAALTATVGTDVFYGQTLELHMSRPFMVPTLLEQADEIAREMTK